MVDKIRYIGLLWVRQLTKWVKMEKNYLTTEEAAEYLKVSAGTLENWRIQKTGPEYCKPSGRVYYRMDDLNKWIEGGRNAP